MWTQKIKWSVIGVEARRGLVLCLLQCYRSHPGPNPAPGFPDDTQHFPPGPLLLEDHSPFLITKWRSGCRESVGKLENNVKGIVSEF